MFAWFISLLMLFTDRGVTPAAPSGGLNAAGNGHVLHAEDGGTNPTNPPNVDGKGTGGGGT